MSKGNEIGMLGVIIMIALLLIVGFVAINHVADSKTNELCVKEANICFVNETAKLQYTTWHNLTNEVRGNE
jgi:hypothetical protein